MKKLPGRVPCQAIVDLVWKPKGLKIGVYRVTVTAGPPYVGQRVYTVRAEDDNMAANNGMDMFEEEMSRPVPLPPFGGNRAP